MIQYIEKEQYEAPEFNLLELHPDLSLLISFSVEGDIDDIDDGGQW